MENYHLDHDIKVFYVTATSFPEGVLAAHQQLHAMLPDRQERKFFGISRPENRSNIVYRAAVEETYDGEAEKFGCKTLLLKKGDYSCVLLNNYMEDDTVIGRAFGRLLSEHDQLDPQGYCVEWYLNDRDVLCMIRLKNEVN